MGDASAVTQPYLPLFRNVPAVRPGVCRICHSGPNESHAAKGPFAVCAGCRRTTAAVRRPTAHVVPISLVCRHGEGRQLYDIVARHRNPPAASGRRDRSTLLAAALARFHRAHRPCLAGAAGGEPTVVTTIPRTAPDRPVEAFDPMPRVVDMVAALRDLHRPVLLPGDPAAEARLSRHQPDEHAFHVVGRLDGARVLLVDDLLVSGARVQSAASALLGAGAEAVVALVIARLVDPTFNGASARIWAQSSAEPYSFGRCCLCDPASSAVDQPA